MATDDEPMAAAAGGDQRAFAEIVSRYNIQAFRLASRFLGNRDEAADIVQEAFLRILSKAGNYRATAAFSTYLFRVVFNLSMDSLRKKRPVAVEGDIVDTSVNPSPSDLEDILVNERAAEVSAAICSLPPRQRLAILLKYYEDFRYIDIAMVLKTSEKGVERLLSRARASLSIRLKNL